jgi:hypothetical protein
MACLFLRNGLAGKIMDPLAVQTPAILAPAPAVKNPAPAVKNPAPAKKF